MKPENNFEDEKERPIESQEKKVAMEEKIMHIQLEYVQKLLEHRNDKEYSPSEDIDLTSLDFFQMIDGFSDLSKRVEKAYIRSMGEPFEGERYADFESKYKEIVLHLQEEYQKNPKDWIEKVDEIILNTLPDHGYLLGPEKFEGSRAGILRYDINAGHGGFEECGISPEDECIKAHLDPLFLQEKVSEGKKLSELYREAYAIIAQVVKEKYPNVKALVADSWLHDTNLAKELGLHILPGRNENLFRGFGFWGQFINREGEINEERVHQLLETGKPPFKVKSGYIHIEEFLEKYLPKA